MPQVCSERILLRTGTSGIDLIPGAIRPLLEADLPLVLWWVGDPREALPLFHELVAEATRVVHDLPDPTTDPSAIPVALDLASAPFGRDLAWFGATKWRELTAQFFDPIGREETLSRITAVTIVAEASSLDHPPRVAAWVAAWLAGQLGWKPKSRTLTGPNKLMATFLGPTGEIRVHLWSELHAEARPAVLSSISITAIEETNELSFRLSRLNEAVAVEFHSGIECRLPRLVHAEEFNVPDRVSAALESARDDPPYRKALPHMIWLVEGSNPIMI